MLVQRKIPAGKVQHIIQGRYFRLVSANSDVKITFVAMNESQWETDVRVGMQVPLESMHKGIFIESKEEQIVEFWWGRTPVDSMVVRIGGAAGIRTDKIICGAGETRLTLPNTIRKSIQLKPDADLFIGSAGSGNLGWPVKKDEIIELPLAGSLFAYNPPAEPDMAKAAHLSTGDDFDYNLQDQDLIAIGENKFMKISDAGTQTVNEFDLDGNLIAAHTAEYGEQTLWARHIFTSQYHNATYILWAAANNSESTLIYDVRRYDSYSANNMTRVISGELNNITDAVGNFRLFMPKNGRIVLYSKDHYIELAASNQVIVNQYHQFDDADLDNGYHPHCLAEFNGGIHGFFNSPLGRTLCRYDYDNLQWISTGLEFQGLVYESSGLNMGDVGGMTYRFSNSVWFFNDTYPEGLQLSGFQSSLNGATLIGAILFIGEVNGNVYTVDEEGLIALYAAVPNPTGDESFGKLFYDNVNHKILSLGGNEAGTANGVKGAVNTFMSPYDQSLLGVNVQIMEFLS